MKFNGANNCSELCWALQNWQPFEITQFGSFLILEISPDKDAMLGTRSSSIEESLLAHLTKLVDKNKIQFGFITGMI